MDEARPVKGLAVVAHAEGQANLPLSKLEELVAGEVIPGDPRAQVLALDGAVVALIGEYGTGEESGALGRAILHRARSALFLSGVRIGIGRPHAGRQGLRRTYREALWAAAVAERLWDGDRVVTFRDLGIYGLLEPLLADPATADTEDVERLIQYDRKNHTALLPTLEMFFDVCSPGETASKLFVHRNTVTYRLRAVKRVTGLDVVSNPDARLHLEVQMRIARLRGILPATKPRPRRVRGRR
jgi:sugar diacid utilization regulator